MPLTIEQLNQLTRDVRKNRCSIQTIEERPSYRYPGQLTEDEVDARGYRAVVVLLERGLGNQQETLRQVLHLVTSVQGDSRLTYPVYLASFGWDDGQLRHGVRPHEGKWHINTTNWVDELLSLAGVEPVNGPATLPAFFPEAGLYRPKPQVWRDALPLIICRVGLRLSEGARKQLSPQLERRAVWVYCKPDSVEVEVGKSPTLIASAEESASEITQKLESSPNNVVANAGKVDVQIESDDLLDRLEHLLKESESQEGEPQKICQMCKQRPATQFRESTWRAGGSSGDRSGMYLCDQCSRNMMF